MYGEPEGLETPLEARLRTARHSFTLFGTTLTFQSRLAITETRCQVAID